MTPALGPLLGVTLLVPAQPPIARSAREIRFVLTQPVLFPGIDSETATLQDVLTLLSARTGVRIRINDAAFRQESAPPQERLRHVGEWPYGKVGPITDRSLEWLLRHFLRDIQVAGLPCDPLTGRVHFDPLTGLPFRPNGPAAFVVLEDRIEITTPAWLLARNRLPEPPPPPTPEQGRRIQEIRTKLGQDLDYPTIDDPKLTLREALSLIEKRHGLKIMIDAAAFTAYEDDLKDVERFPIFEQYPLEGREGQTLDALLRRVLAYLPNYSGAVYVIRPNGIEVTTAPVLAEEYRLPEPPAPPTKKQLALALSLRDRLLRPAPSPRIDDPKTSLGEALELLEKRYDLRFEINYAAFVSGPDDLKDVPKFPIAERRSIIGYDAIAPGKVLELILARLPNASGAVFVIRPRGYIEITTKHFLRLELQGIDTSALRPEWGAGL